DSAERVIVHDVAAGAANSRDGVLPYLRVQLEARRHPLIHIEQLRVREDRVPPQRSLEEQSHGAVYFPGRGPQTWELDAPSSRIRIILKVGRIIHRPATILDLMSPRFRDRTPRPEPVE